MTRTDELRKTIADAQAELDALEQPVDSWRTADDWGNRVEVRGNCNDGITITARREDGSYMSPLSTHDATAMALQMLELCGVNLYQPVIDRLRELCDETIKRRNEHPFASHDGWKANEMLRKLLDKVIAELESQEVK